ncbi:hypothetical protein RB653_000472 [Dictyostelium firmibasis]|uniref:Uncharacterized protein n=1 Tax=Dictyostelium firmibasis TaxID=79012 RepID=A0AAN7U714_9MYCE
MSETKAKQLSGFTLPEAFSDSIASENNSNKSETITPIEGSLCITDVFSFSIQMNNLFLGVDIKISIQGTSNVSQCYKNPTVDEKLDEIIINPSPTLKNLITGGNYV